MSVVVVVKCRPSFYFVGVAYGHRLCRREINHDFMSDYCDILADCLFVCYTSNPDIKCLQRVLVQTVLL